LFKESRIDDLKFTAQIREFEPAGQRAFELFHTGRNTEALSLADGLIAQNCSYLQIYSVRAYALHNLGRNPEAWQACITCTNKTGEVDDPLRYWILWSMRDWNGALVYVQKMIKKNPKDHGLYFLRAECLKNLEKYGEALSDYDRFPDVMNDNPSAHDGRAECLLRLGKDNEAAKELQVINSTRPTFQSLEQEARCYRSLKRYSEAVTCFTKAIILRPLSAPNIAARAECYRRLKDYPRALKDFSDAITLSPKFFVYFYGRGLCYLDMNRNEDAVQDFTAALADPNLQSRAYADRARAYEKLGKKLLAQKDRLAANSANSASRAIEDDLFK
jgi:tetratricopeptide (TPR) repeat protein